MPVEIKIYAETADEVRDAMERLLGRPGTGVEYVQVEKSSGDVFKDIGAERPSTMAMNAASEPKKRGRSKKDEVAATTVDDNVTEADEKQAENVVEGDPETGPDVNTGEQPRTYDETRALLLKLSAKITPPKAMAFLEEQGGVKKLGDMKEADYGAFYAKVAKELGEGTR